MQSIRRTGIIHLLLLAFILITSSVYGNRMVSDKLQQETPLLQDLEGQKNSIHLKIQMINDSLNFLLAKKARLSEELKILQAQKKGIETLRAKLGGSVDSGLKSLDSMIMKLERERSFLKHQLPVLKNKSELINKLIDQLKSEKKIKEDLLTNLILSKAKPEQIESFEQRIKLFNDSIKMKLEEVKNTNSKIMEIEQRLVEIDDTLSQLSDMVRARYFDQKKLNQFFQEKLTKLDQNINSKKQSISQLDSSIDQLKALNNQLIKDSKDLESKITEFRSQEKIRQKEKAVVAAESLKKEIPKKVSQQKKNFFSTLFLVVVVILIVLTVLYFIGKSTKSKK